MEAPLANQRVAGRYTLRDTIADGRTSTVWVADDHVLARRVAVKVLKREFASDAAIVERFSAAAVAGASLIHPSIVRVFDTGVEATLPYIVMEYLHGEDLGRVLEGVGRVDPADAAVYTARVLAALEFAHSRNVVHGELEPSNVLVTSEGEVKLTNFRCPPALAAANPACADRRSDIVATGALLYELLTNRPPLRGSRNGSTSDVVPPRAIRPDIPRGLEAVVSRALDPAPNTGFASAHAMRLELERQAVSSHPTVGAASRGPVEQHSPRRRSSLFGSWLLVPLVALVVTVVVVTGSLILGRLEFGGPLGVEVPRPRRTVTPSISRLRLVAAADYDPQGDGGEHPEEVSWAVDGDPTTAWRTDRYTTEAFGNLKRGLGLWVAFRGPARWRRIAVTSPRPGWKFQLMTGSSPTNVGPPISTRAGRDTFTMSSSGRSVVAIPEERGAGVLIWITSLGADEDRFAAEVSEVAVWGRV